MRSKRTTITVLLLLTVGTAICSHRSALASTTEFFVAPNGQAENLGTPDAPLTFDEAARRASEILKKDGLPAGGIRLTLKGGRYSFSKPTVLTKEFKGTQADPIVIQNAPGESVVFDGGARISPEGFAPVTDAEERARLANSAVDQIRAKTIEDRSLIAKFRRKLMLTLSYNDGIYLPSVFPNQGYAMMDNDPVVPEVAPPGIPVGQEGYGIRAGSPPHQEPGKRQGWKGTLAEPRGAQAGIAKREGEMAGSWNQWEKELARDNQRNLHTGFIDANWLLRSQPLVASNAEQKCMHLSSVLSYGWAWRKDKPFKVFGLLCELDQPGEWHFDTLTNRLYLYPPQPLDADTKISLPLAEGFIELRDTAHLSVIGLNVQNVGGGAVYRIGGGHHNLIAGCVIQNSTARGLVISGTHNGASGCDLVDLNAHVALGGGRRSAREITSGNNYVENCHIYQRNFRHQKVHVAVNGVGNRLSNNLIHNSLGQAVTIHGNDHLLELNELFNIGFEEGDGGAMYAGGDLAAYGVTYRHNFFHHLMHVPGKVERSGIHLDDLQAGSTCVGNIFYKSAAKGIFMNGGSGHTILGNVFLEGYRGIYNTGHHGQKDHDRQEAIFHDPDNMYRNTKENYIGRTERIVGPEGWTKSPWKDKYPVFHQVMIDQGQYGRFWPIRCRVEGNRYYGNTRNSKTVWSRCAPAVRAKSIIRADGVVHPDDFVDYQALDLRFKNSGSGAGESSAIHASGQPTEAHSSPDASDSQTHKDGANRNAFPEIPFAKIGLRLDLYRRAMPDKTHYRASIKRFYDGIGSMPGTNRQIDTARIVEEGPQITQQVD